MKKLCMNHYEQCENSNYRFSHDNKTFSFYNLPQCNLPDLPYVELRSEQFSVLYWGQLKLLLSELLFLEPYKKIQNIIVVYFGSSPGHHLDILINLMPKSWTWRLYDETPSEVFCNKFDERVILKKYKNEKQKSIRRKYVKNVAVFDFLLNELEAEIIHHKFVKKTKLCYVLAI